MVSVISEISAERCGSRVSRQGSVMEVVPANHKTPAYSSAICRIRHWLLTDLIDLIGGLVVLN